MLTRQEKNFLGSGKATLENLGGAWALSERGHENGGDFYVIYEHGVIVRASPALVAEVEGRSRRTIQRRTKSGAYPSLQVRRTREVILNARQRAGVQEFLDLAPA